MRAEITVPDVVREIYVLWLMLNSKFAS